MKSVDRQHPSPDDRADYDIIQNQISAALIELSEIQSYRHNPTQYVELIGTGLFSAFTLQYADLNTRYEHIISRIENVPRLLRDAMRNLNGAPEIWTRVALAGNAGLIEKTLRASVPEHLEQRYDSAAGEALRALRNFDAYLSDDLIGRRHDCMLQRAPKRPHFNCAANQPLISCGSARTLNWSAAPDVRYAVMAGSSVRFNAC